MNYVISPGREFADGCRILDEGDTIPNSGDLGHVPEFGAICEFSYRGNDAICE